MEGKVFAIAQNYLSSYEVSHYSMVLAPQSTRKGNILCILPDSHSSRFNLQRPRHNDLIPEAKRFKLGLKSFVEREGARAFGMVARRAAEHERKENINSLLMESCTLVGECCDLGTLSFTWQDCETYRNRLSTLIDLGTNSSAVYKVSELGSIN